MKQLLFLADALRVIRWHSSTRETVNALLSEQREELTECFRLPDSGLVTPPLSARQRRAALRRSWPYSVRFFSSTFCLSSWISIFLLCASERCQAWWGKKALWWCRLPVDALQTQGTLPIMYAHHALVHTHAHTDTVTHLQELTKAHSCGICASERQKGLMSCLSHNWHYNLGYKSWPGLIHSLAGDDQGQSFNTSHAPLIITAVLVWHI